MSAPVTATATAQPAGFWQRAAAWSLDAVPVALLALAASWSLLAPAYARFTVATDAMLQMLATAMADALRAHATGSAALAELPLALVPATLRGAAELSPSLWSLLWPPLLAFTALEVLWHGSFEASRWQASPGKRLLGLRVTDMEGRRPGTGRAFARQIAGSLSWLTLNLGHLVAMSGPEHRALHDHIAGTRVLADRVGLPAWGWAWLVAAALAPIVAVLALVTGGINRLQFLLDQALWY